jgi:hypothetical protein
MTAFMSDPQVPDPHAVATDDASVSTLPVFDPPPEHVPVLTSLTPNTALAGSQPLGVTVVGENFEPTSVVVAGGEYTWETQYVDAQTLIVTVHPELSVAGTISVFVRNVNAYESGALDFTFT